MQNELTGKCTMFTEKSEVNKNPVLAYGGQNFLVDGGYPSENFIKPSPGREQPPRRQ